MLLTPSLGTGGTGITVVGSPDRNCFQGSGLPVAGGDGGVNKDDGGVNKDDVGVNKDDVGVNKDDGSVDMADDCGCCT